jgi:hypothetical protein
VEVAAGLKAHPKAGLMHKRAEMHTEVVRPEENSENRAPKTGVQEPHGE